MNSEQFVPTHTVFLAKSIAKSKANYDYASQDLHQEACLTLKKITLKICHWTVKGQCYHRAHSFQPFQKKGWDGYALLAPAL